MTQPLLFTPLSIRDLNLENRVVVAPMHQYAAVKGFANDWHVMNAGRYAAVGAGLVMVESTKIARGGCGTIGDLGLWNDAFVPPASQYWLERRAVTLPEVRSSTFDVRGLCKVDGRKRLVGAVSSRTPIADPLPEPLSRKVPQ